MILKIVITVFVVFTLAEIFSEYKKKNIRLYFLFFWGFLWLAVFSIVWFPGLTIDLAKVLGIVRGIDAVVYPSVVLLFYLVFRIILRIEKIEKSITKMVRDRSLQDLEKN
jgi:small membrane protein